MSASDVHRRNNGVYYTPENLATFAAREAISLRDLTVFDPSFGKGALLDASLKVLEALGTHGVSKYLYGCDIQPVNSREIPFSLREARLAESDFFMLPVGPRRRYDAVLMNPPYVRHHRMDRTVHNDVIEDLRTTFGVQRTSDLWVYFVLRAFVFLKKGASLTAILPWSFLFADYARRVREVIVNNFESVRTTVIGKRVFEAASERVVVLSARGFGGKAVDIRVSFSHEIPADESNHFRPISREEWMENPYIFTKDSRASRLLKRISEEGWQPLSSYSTVAIGVVTGANGYFALTRDTIRQKKLPIRCFQPIITSSKYLRAYETRKTECHRYLLSLNSKPLRNKNLLDYIEEMRAAEVDKRLHCRNRKPWYSVKITPISDAFLHCTTTDVPCIVFNPEGLQSTNAVHKVFFDASLTESQKRWIRLSFLSSISQLSIEANCRTYGGGVLKLEPSEAGRVLVYGGNSKDIPERLETEIDTYLRQGEREIAIRLATKCCVDVLGVDKELATEAFELRETLRQQRKSK